MAGTRNLPYEIEQAAIEIVRGAFYSTNRDPNIKAESVEGVGSITYFDTNASGNFGSIPDKARSLLSALREYSL